MKFFLWLFITQTWAFSISAPEFQNLLKKWIPGHYSWKKIELKLIPPVVSVEDLRFEIQEKFPLQMKVKKAHFRLNPRFLYKKDEAFESVTFEGVSLDASLSVDDFNESSRSKALSLDQSEEIAKVLASAHQTLLMAFEMILKRVHQIEFQQIEFNLDLLNKKEKISLHFKIPKLFLDPKSLTAEFLEFEAPVALKAKDVQKFRFWDKLSLVLKVTNSKLEIQTLACESKNFSWNLFGNWTGNLKDGQAWFIWKGSLEIASFLKEIQSLEVPDWLSPVLKFKGAQGFLQAKAEGAFKIQQAHGSFSFPNLEVSGSELSAEGFQIQKLLAQASFNQEKGENRFLVQKIEIQSPEKKRSGSAGFASGGVIKVEPFVWIPGQKNLEIALQMKKVHPHTLLGEAAKNIFNLSFWYSGRAEIAIKPTGAAYLNLSGFCEELIFDNQMYQDHPSQVVKIFNLPKVSFKAKVKTPPHFKSFYLDHVELLAPGVKLEGQGSVDPKQGVQLSAYGYLERKNALEKLADIPLNAYGDFHLTVEGSPELPKEKGTGISIQLNFQDSRFLDFNLGKVRAQISIPWNEKRLNVDDCSGSLEKTDYSVKGHLDLDAQQQLFFTVDSPQGAIEDLLFALEPRTVGMAYFPKAQKLRGSVNSHFEISGNASPEGLQIQGAVTGTQWSYFDEKFKAVSFQAGFKKGIFFLRNLELLKRSGKLLGFFEISPQGEWHWNFHTENLQFGEFDRLMQLNFPVRGSLQVDSSGRGLGKTLVSQTKIDFENLRLKGEPYPSSHLEIQSQGGVRKIDLDLMGGQAIGHLSLDSENESKFDLDLNQLNFAPFLLLLNPNLTEESNLNCELVGRLDLKAPQDHWDKAQGAGFIKSLEISNAQSFVKLSQPIQAQIVAGEFSTGEILFESPMESFVVSAKRSTSQKKWTGSLEGGLSLALFGLFFPQIDRASGVLETQARLEKPFEKPLEFRANAIIRKGLILFDGFDPIFQNISGNLNFEKNILSFEQITADLGQGNLKMNGSVDWFNGNFSEPKINIKSHLNRASLKFFPFHSLQTGGVLKVYGDKVPYLISGSLQLTQAEIQEPILKQKKAFEGTRTIESIYAPVSGAAHEASISKFLLDIFVDTGPGIEVNNDLFKAFNLTGKINIVNSMEAPRILGELNGSQGKLLVKDQNFDVQVAKIKFDNPKLLNPDVELRAKTEISSYQVELFAKGRVDKPQDFGIDFTSQPPLINSEILSLLTSGLTSKDTSQLSFRDKDNLQRGEVMSLALKAMDLNRDLESKTGFKFQVDQIVDSRQGVSAFKPQAGTDNLTANQFTLKGKINDHFIFSAGNAPNFATQFNLSYLINLYFALSGTFLAYSTTAETQAYQGSIGLDFRYQRRFR